MTSEESEEWNKVWPIVKRAGVKSTRVIYHSPKLAFATASFVILLIACSCISLQLNSVCCLTLFILSCLSQNICYHFFYISVTQASIKPRASLAPKSDCHSTAAMVLFHPWLLSVVCTASQARAWVMTSRLTCTILRDAGYKRGKVIQLICGLCRYSRWPAANSIHLAFSFSHF